MDGSETVVEAEKEGELVVAALVPTSDAECVWVSVQSGHNASSKLLTLGVRSGVSGFTVDT